MPQPAYKPRKPIPPVTADEAKRIVDVERDAAEIAAESSKIREATMRHTELVAAMGQAIQQMTSGHTTRISRETS